MLAREFFGRVLRKLSRTLGGVSSRCLYLFKPSFSIDSVKLTRHSSERCAFLDEPIAQQVLFELPPLGVLVREQAARAIAHSFDLLGSGPCVVAHGLSPLGFETWRHPEATAVCPDRSGRWLVGRINRSNLKHSQTVWKLVGADYVPIDWQLDFKSGHRWREKDWHRGVVFGHLPGVDIKVPWELGRLQHLSTVALACHFGRANAPGFRGAEAYAGECRNQILDFIATNPPGFGVNWACPMDVAIRCANLLVAHDILVASGTSSDDAFERCFTASIYAHARHVVKNLEWSPVYRGNHYLANVVGLLFAAAYLPAGEEVDSWLVFATQELFAEVRYQFHEDGSNFEASVCYHRLSAEMVLWGFAVLTGLSPEKRAVLAHPERHRMKALPRLHPTALEMHPVPGAGERISPVPPWCWERLRRMADFTEALTRPDGNVVQFGDNDSGRFIVLMSGEQMRADNDPSNPLWSLDHSALVASIRTLIGEPANTQGIDDAGAWFVRRFAGLENTDAAHARNTLLPPPIVQPHRVVGGDGVWEECLHTLEQAHTSSRWTSRFAAASDGLKDDIECASFPGMGCYVFRNERLFLAVRCGEIGVSGLGAHAHGDQLAIELVIDGENHVRDPGTYVYTPSPQKRNAYRSARAHHVPHVEGREPINLALGLFDLRGASPGECLYFGPRGFIGRHKGYGMWVMRIVVLEDAGITIHDVAEGGLTLSSSSPDPVPFSPAYGRVLG